ncbi:glycosyl transferase family 90 [Helicobacter trogontum]|uniref:Lipopolysaccharide core biosynthesis protein LpsA n=1 Tax=Helicobacter trogontum TaxID=50960 RepID=A0A4U8T6J9_9HELI|nr:glycosyl transferase family 90 [Helicobacter trogontum]MCI5786718.1 lipopolysaccharide core biosynthesis protein LpsA [Helicobacter trogontum]MDY5185835.1 glycosyl transferase family 90 [Helicobacter trogontum]TLD94267.1 lipopolysaccharide core biosynthesis protein LpsA [Helicobacter trogontum]
MQTRGSRFIYNLKGIMRMMILRIITQKQLEVKIQKLLQTYDKELEVISNRINYYNKLDKPFCIPSTQDKLAQVQPLQIALPPYPSRLSSLQQLVPNIDILKNNTYKAGSVYFYDSYEWTRYFKDDLRWAYMFYDVCDLLSFPAICKSRPIISCNNNSVLLQLEKYRHFHFIHDPIRFEDKKDILLFRGAVYQDHRIRFFEKHFTNPNCDIGHVGRLDSNPQWIKNKLSIQEHLPYKFLLSLEGYDVASNLKWVLSSNSLCIMPEPEMETWFMEQRLEKGVHFAAINRDYSDLDSVLEYYKTHTNEAKEIIQNAHAFCMKFYDKRLEGLLNLLVLRKYFYLSGQIDISPLEQTLFKLD